jgi:hypothetical protein
MGISLDVIFVSTIVIILFAIVILGFVCADHIENKAMKRDIKDMRGFLENGASKITGELNMLEKEAGIIHAEMYGMEK